MTLKKYTYRPILSEEQIAEGNRQRTSLERIVGSVFAVSALLLAWNRYPGLNGSFVYEVVILVALLPIAVGYIIEGNILDCKPISADELAMLSNWSHTIIDGRGPEQDESCAGAMEDVDAEGKKFRDHRMPGAVAAEVDARMNAILNTRQFIAKHEFDEIRQRVLSLLGPMTGADLGMLKPDEAISPKLQAILSKFPRTGSLLLLFTTVVFFGFNLFVWTFSRAKVLNEHSLEPVSLRWVYLGLALYVAAYIQAYLITQITTPSSLEAFDAQLGVLIALMMSGLTCLVIWLFRFRARLHTLLGVSSVMASSVPTKRGWLWPQDPRWIEGSFLFCFNVFYLNYKMNRILALSGAHRI